MILWREKFRAFGLHFIATLTVALLAAALIFFVWYPAPFGTMVGGLKLFLLVCACDLVLGPLVSLVIYNSRKSRRALIFDYTLVGLVQLTAFLYGVYSVSQNRPAYVAFVKDRIEVVAAGEIGEKDRLEAKGLKYEQPPKWGPVMVATFVKPEDKNDAMWTALEGRDISVRPKFYVDYDSQLESVKQHLQPLADLQKRHPQSENMIAEALRELKRPADDLGWLPVKHTRGFWTALVDRRTGHPLKYIPVDPY